MPPLFGFDLAGPATWGVLPTEEPTGPDRDRVLAAIEATGRDLTSSPEAYEVFAIMAGHLHPPMSKDAHLALAVWVPDPDTGEIWAVLALDHLVGEGEGAAELKDFVPTLGTGMAPSSRAVRTDVERCSFPLGEAVLLVALEADADGGLEVRVQFTVFPTMCRDALQLTALTPRLQVEDILIGETAIIMDHPASGSRRRDQPPAGA
jgi:hypothetical protein